MVIKSNKNYYEILGVCPDSEASEVKSAYRSLARKFHPDINKEPDSLRHFKDILEAYQTLSDEIKRKQYDMVNGFYKTPKNASRTEQKTETQTPPHKEYERSRQHEENLRRKFFKDSINSVTDEIIKKHYAKKSKPAPKDGEDIHTDISITLGESLNGTERVLNIMHKELCPNCKGRKFINGSKCSVCEGTGEFSIHKKITVKIPPNIKNNSKLRLLNEGNPGFYGGKNGNLYITVMIENNEKLQLDGLNILYNLPITPFEAVLGGIINIPVFDGDIHLMIPPMTQSGQKFRLAAQGLKTNGKFGDMIVTVEIQIPQNLTAEEVKMYEKLKKMSQGSIRENIKND